MTGWRASAATLAFAASSLSTLGLTQTTSREATGISSLASTGLPGAITAISVTSTTSPSTSPSSEPQIHLVKVGAGGFRFEPAELTNVSTGDVVTFEFYPPDHSVARAEYGSACVPYEYTGKDKIGFWSTTQWVETASDITHWNLTINNTEPIFYYCAAPNSCKGELMVGTINPNGTQTLDAQIRAAKKADFQVAPGETVPDEASSTLIAPTATSSQKTSTPINLHRAGLSTAAIVGIVFGGIAFIALCAAMLLYVAKETRMRHRAVASTHSPMVDTSPDVPGYPPPFSPLTTSSFECPYENYPSPNNQAQARAIFGAPLRLPAELEAYKG